MAHSVRLNRKVIAASMSAILVCALSFPVQAFASVDIDGTAVAEGDNSIDGGTVTRVGQVIDMVNVTATNVSTDEDVTFNFDGGNSISNVNVTGDANVTANFQCENQVEDFKPQDNATLTINANGHNEFDEVEARENAQVTINVTGENDFETIKGTDNASITIRGAECQRKAIINVGEADDVDDQTRVITESGDLTIDHVTMNLVGKDPLLGSSKGSVRIDTAKISYKGDGNATLYARAGELYITESVIELLQGSMHSQGLMTIEHSDVKVENGSSSHPAIWSESGIRLIREKNGEVKTGTFDGKKLWYVDTDDNLNKVDLKADGQPEYYRCATDNLKRPMPKTGDGLPAEQLLALSLVSLAALLFASRQMIRVGK